MLASKMASKMASRMWSDVVRRGDEASAGRGGGLTDLYCPAGTGRETNFLTRPVAPCRVWSEITLESYLQKQWKVLPKYLKFFLSSIEAEAREGGWAAGRANLFLLFNVRP